MSKYLKKEDVIKALEHSRGASDYLIDILAEIECVPTADVVEVVRCKDCKKRNTEKCMMNNTVGMNKDLFDDDYCSYGKRKEQGND